MYPSNAEVSASLMESTAVFRVPELEGASVARTSMGVPRCFAGTMASVYQVHLANGGALALRIPTCDAYWCEDHYREVANYLAHHRISSLVKFNFHAEGIRIGRNWFPMMLMEWVSGDSLFNWVRNKALQNDVKALQLASSRWPDVVRELETHRIVHGDLSESNILVTKNVSFRLVDYDCLGVPALFGQPVSEIGTQPYQHPRRDFGTVFAPELGRFSALVIAVALRALASDPGLWVRHVEACYLDRLLFSESDFRQRDRSPLFRELLASPDAQVRRLSRQLLAASEGEISDVLPLDSQLFDFDAVRALLDRQNDHQAIEIIRRNGLDLIVPPDLAQRLDIATRRVESLRKLESAIRTGNEVEIAGCYAVVGEALKGFPAGTPLVEVAIRAGRALEVLDRIKRAVSKHAWEEVGAICHQDIWVFDGRFTGPEVARAKEVFDNWRERNRLFNEVQRIAGELGDFAELERAWDRLNAMGGHPDSDALRAQIEQTIRRTSEEVERLLRQPPGERRDQELLASRNTASIAKWPMAIHVHGALAEARERLRVLHEMRKCPSFDTSLGGTVDGILLSLAARLPTGYLLEGDLRERVQLAAQRMHTGKHPTHEIDTEAFTVSKLQPSHEDNDPPPASSRGEPPTCRQCGASTLRFLDRQNLWVCDSCGHQWSASAGCAEGGKADPQSSAGAPAAAPGFARCPRSSETESVPPTVSSLFDDDVQFTVYRPTVVIPRKWYPLLAFAHLAGPTPDAPPQEPDPVEQVRQQAEAVLGKSFKEYRKSTDDARQAVPKEGQLTFTVHLPGFDIDPPAHTVRWIDSVRGAEFRIRADGSVDGRQVRGRLSVRLDSILLADVVLSIRVDSKARDDSAKPPTSVETVKPYRRIFASYSHKDLHIVEEFERYGAVLGDRYLRDWTHLRAGEVWSEGLQKLIVEADVFQLFWSRSSMQSDFVRQEWEFALSLNRPAFIRPCYWQDPFPEIPPNLPPTNLKRIHFDRLKYTTGRNEDPRGEVGPGATPEWQSERLGAPASSSTTPSGRSIYSQEIRRGQRRCVVILLDQSAPLQVDAAATGEGSWNWISRSIDEWLYGCVIRSIRGSGIRDELDIAVIGTRSTEDTGPVAESAFRGQLSGQWFQSIPTIAETPPNRPSERRGGAPGEPADQSPRGTPSWIAPLTEGCEAASVALTKCHELVEGWIKRNPDGVPPIVIQVSWKGLSADAIDAAVALKSFSTSQGPLVLFICKLSTTNDIPVRFPDSERSLPNPVDRRLFRVASLLPESSRNQVNSAGGIELPISARGLAIGFDRAGLVRFLDATTASLWDH